VKQIFKNNSCKHFEEHGFDLRKEISTVSLYCRKKQKHIGLDDCRHCEDVQEQEEE